jgi:hypothetical protein
LRNYSDAVYHKAMDIANEIQKISCYDHAVMKLLILIFLLSKGADYSEPILIESKKVFHSQNVFVDLLWNYMNVRFGYDQAASVLSRLIFYCMKTHSLARETKETVIKNNVQENDLVPLMQSVLKIS